MSGKTALGAGDGALGLDESEDEPELQTLVTDALEGVEPTAIVYRENTGTLADPTEAWHRFDALEDLPDHAVDGWDELYVYTDTHVYRWVGVGFAAGPERLPRDPEALPASE